MSLVFTPTTQTAERSPFLGLEGAFILVGTLTFAGSYATGGDTFASGQNLEDYARRLGAGKVLAVLTPARGNTLEWDATAKKLKVFASANTEAAAAGYNAALTASPVPFIALLR